MKRKLLTLFLVLSLLFNTSFPVLSEGLDEIENIIKTITDRLDEYNERLKEIELKPASPIPVSEYSPENDSKILLMAYKNANVLSYKLIELIKKDKKLKNEKKFILLTEKSSITDKLLYDRSVKYVNESAKKLKELNKKLELLISKKEKRAKEINNKIEVLISKCNGNKTKCISNTDPVSVSLTGLAGIVSLVSLANEVANAFKSDINSLKAQIPLDNKVLNSIFYNNFEKNGIILEKIDDYLLKGNQSVIYSKLIDVICEIEQAQMHIAVLKTSYENDFKQEAKKAESIVSLLSPSINKLTKNISKLVNYELSKNPKTPVIYVKFVHNVGNIKIKQYKNIVINLFKSDKLMRSALTGMNYEIKTLNSTKKDIIWGLESNQIKFKHDNKLNLHNNKSYIFRYNPIKKLPTRNFNHI